MEEEKKELNVKELLEKLVTQQDTIIKTKKEKEWKFPWSARVSNGLAKKNYATFCIIQDNKEVKFLKAPIEDGTVNIEGIPRLALSNYALNYKGKSFYVIPLWSLKPFSPELSVDETYKDHMNSSGRRVILAKLEKEAIKPKSNMGSGWLWILLALAVGGVGYYLYTGGKLF